MWRNLEHSIDRDPGRDATWHIARRPIAREINAIDLHLSEGDMWRDRIHRIAF